MIIHPGNKKLKLSDKMDKDGLLFYTFLLKPRAWTADTELIEGDVRAPSTPTGYYYEVTSSGVTGSTEPTWTTEEDEVTTDNTVKYKAVNNSAYLADSDTLDTINSAFEASDSVPIANESFTAEGVASVKVGPVPEGVNQFTLTLKFFATTGHATDEYDEYSVIIKVVDR